MFFDDINIQIIVKQPCLNRDFNVMRIYFIGLFYIKLIPNIYFVSTRFLIINLVEYQLFI